MTKFNATGSALIYSSYLGGSGDDCGKGIAIDWEVMRMSREILVWGFSHC